ncbi:putative transcription factor WD40-like family [Rosa chinensis]|uniref:Putative transcription factor WD40-like family n=1 Tax=Rosa chinensis TaxID=74649 RepID=A0A2P6QR14_ROSCH|nr:putative transcription factor WD40-like family [Rosa chinensis]
MIHFCLIECVCKILISNSVFCREEVFQVGWNPKNETILASCCLGRRLMVWDLSRLIMLMLSMTICTRSHVVVGLALISTMKDPVKE